MTSKHADPPLPVRAPARDVASARAVLDEHGWQLTAFIGACLAAVAEEPAALLPLLAKHRPPTKRRGRPASVRSTERTDASQAA